MKQVILSFIIICIGHLSFGQLIINTNTTWSTNQVLTQPVIVNQGATLTINPGVVVSVLFIDNNNDLIGDVKIDVLGKIIANGDVCNKISFLPYITTTNKKYWGGINLNSNVTGNSIKNFIITNAFNGLNILNTNVNLNGGDINNCFNNGVLMTGQSSTGTISNLSIKSCDSEGFKIDNCGILNINLIRVKNCLKSGLFINNTSNLSLKNSLLYDNAKSGVFLSNSSLTIDNSICRKNSWMGITVVSSTFNGQNLDIDSNLVDGLFISSQSNVNVINSSFTRNQGYGAEVTEYFINEDFGDVYLTSFNPVVSISNCNFIKNRISSTQKSSLIFANMFPSNGFSAINPPNGGTACGSNCGCNCASATPIDEFCYGGNTSIPVSWLPHVSFHIPFGTFGGFSGVVGVNPVSNAYNYRPKYGISIQGDEQNPFWIFNYTATSTYNPMTSYSNGCYPIGGAVNTIMSDKVVFSAASGGTTSGPNVGSYVKWKVDEMFFNFGGFEFRSLINSTSETHILTNNFWDTIVPTGVINSVGATLNINGFQIFEILASHSNLSNTYIYGNNNYFELVQNNNSFCTGTTNYLIAPTGNYSYSWFNGTSPIVNNNDSLLIQSNGIYSASISGTCNAISFPVSVSLSNGIPISINTSGATTFCSGGNVTLTSPSSTGNLWSNGATTQSITVSNSGNYSVSVSSSQGCPSVSPAVTVNIISLPQAPVITSSGNTTFCANNSVILTSNISGNLIWSNSMNSQSIIVTTSGLYSVQQIVNGCSSLPSNTIQITVNPNPISTISNSGPTTICQGNLVTLSAPFVSGNQYQWFNNNVPINGAINNSLAVTTTGSYTVSVNNGTCTSTTNNPTIITVNNTPTAPTISANGNIVFCQGGNVTLISNNQNVIWSNGATSQSISISQTGNYSAQTVLNGCYSLNSNLISVTVNALPVMPTITTSGPSAFCFGGSVNLYSSYSNNNTWSNGSSMENITVSNSGTFTVTYTNTNGCSSTSSPITITVNPIPSSPVITANGPTTFCDGANVTLTSNLTIGNTWSNNSQNQSITVTSSGSYFSTITENGCTSLPSNFISVSVNPMPSQPTITASGPTTFCSGSNVILTSSSSSGNLWNNGLNSQSITVNNTGQYSVQVSQNGCSSTSNSITITVNPTPPAPTIIASGPTSFCQGSNVTLTTNASNGVTWTASNGNQYPVPTLIVQTAQSNLFATVTLNGCTSLPSQSISTTVQPIVTPTFNPVSSICAGTALNNLPLQSNNGINGTWNPNINNQVTTNYIFTPLSGQCSNNANLTITVFPNPNVTLSNFNDVCDTVSSINLIGGSPLGGVYSGLNVSNNQFFTNNHVGTYWIIYSYTNSNGCSNIDSSSIYVIDCSNSSVTPLEEISGVLFYPSPTNDIVYVKGLSNEIIGEEINIFDQTGRLLYSRVIEEKDSIISLGKYNDGIYLIYLKRRNLFFKVIKH